MPPAAMTAANTIPAPVTLCSTSAGASIEAAMPKIASGSWRMRIASSTATSATAAAPARPTTSPTRWYTETAAKSDA